MAILFSQLQAVKITEVRGLDDVEPPTASLRNTFLIQPQKCSRILRCQRSSLFMHWLLSIIIRSLATLVEKRLMPCFSDMFLLVNCDQLSAEQDCAIPNHSIQISYLSLYANKKYNEILFLFSIVFRTPQPFNVPSIF